MGIRGNVQGIKQIYDALVQKGALKSKNTFSTMKPPRNIYRQSNDMKHDMKKCPQTFTEETMTKSNKNQG